MFSDYEIRNDEENFSKKANSKVIKSIKIFSLVFFALTVCQTGYSVLFIQFFNDSSFAFYCVSSLLLAVGLIVLFIIAGNPNPYFKRIFILSLIIVVLSCIHIATLFWISDALSGCDSMFLILAVPYGFIAGIICIVFLSEAVIFGWHIKNLHK